MAKKRRVKKRRKVPRSFLILLSTLTLLLIFIAGGFSIYQLGFAHGQKAERKNLTNFSKLKEREQKALRSIISEVEDYKQSQKEQPKPKGKQPTQKRQKQKEHKKPSLAYEPKKPKLVIIIDDVAYGYQVRALKSLHIPVTLSFFPPSSRHPNTPKYAKTFRHYMIHLPLEAVSFRHEEERTLSIGSSYSEIEKRIQEIRRLFPRARFVNNHTGSRFTADLAAMRRLVSVLQRYGFYFVDSRTTAKTQVPKVMREFGYPYIHRDIFIDNELDVARIKEQIKKAVRLAKRKGYAIAIGHPHRKTIEALRASKGVLKEVRLVYIDELFKDR